jgi:hypothetical protein
MSEYTDAVERNLMPEMCASVGACPGCEDCWGVHAPDATEKEFEEMWRRGEIPDEAGFSTQPCGVCGTYLHGDRYVWHWLADDRTIHHEEDCCSDCAMYLANGDEPEDWRKS